MTLLSFLSRRQIGAVGNNGFIFNEKPKLDNLIFRVACGDDDVYTSNNNRGPPFACKFRRDQSQDLLAVANEDGIIQLVDTERTGIVDSFRAHHNAIFDVCWFPDKPQLVTASGDTCASLWDMKTLKKICYFRRHTESIKSVDVCPTDSNLFATGSRDGSICVWDARIKCSGCGLSKDKPSIYISLAHNRKDTKNSFKKNYLSCVSAVVFQNDRHLVSAGAGDGVVKVWDLRKSYICKPNQIPTPRYQMEYSDPKSGRGCTSLVFDSTFRKLYGCCTLNKIFLFDCNSFSKPVVFYEGFRCDTYFVKIALSVDDQYLVSGSSDGKACVWKTNKPGLPIMQLSGHNSEVTGVAWGSNDLPKIVTCGDDNKFLVWKVINPEWPEERKFSYALPSAYNREKKCPGDLCKFASLLPPILGPLLRKTSTSSSHSSQLTNFFKPERLLETSLLKSNSDSPLHCTENKTNSSEQSILSHSENVNRKENVSFNVLDCPIRIFNEPNRQGEISKFNINSIETSTQVKRKLDSTPKLGKKQSIKKGKKNHSSDKKKNGRNSGSIRDYFNTSPSPEE